MNALAYWLTRKAKEQSMSKRLHQPQFAIAFATMLAVVSLLGLAGSLAIAAPSAATEAAQPRQETTGTTAITDTTAVTDTAGHLLHHPEEAAASVTETVSLPGMMGMMGEMMSMMGNMQGMMGEEMMGPGMMMGSQMTSTTPMTGTLPMMGGAAISDCMMIGPMMSMMGSMMSMMGAMQTLQGMMAGHAVMGPDMMGQGMMGMGMMGSTAMTDTMPMQGAVPVTGAMMGQGMMGMMEDSEMGFMLEHMMQMMGQMQAMVTSCQQSEQAGSDQAFDLHFIDSMIEHHEGAVAMAQQALEQAEHDELKQMAQEIISTQEAEIAQLQEWRTAWYPDAAPTTGMGMEMGAMEVAEGDAPFDLRFIDAMIPHHEGAIQMAQAALTSAQHDEIKQMAQAIIDAQQAEIAQLQEWRAAWYPDAQ